MTYEATGEILLVKDEQGFNSNFRKREFILKTRDGEYTQEISMELHNEKCDLLNKLDEGKEMKVFFNIRGKAYKKPGQEDKWFNALVCYKIE